MKNAWNSAWCSVMSWKLSIIRCCLYGGLVSWGVFKAGTNGFDGLNQMTPLQKIDLAGDMTAAFGGVLLAFLDNSIAKLSSQQNTDSTMKQPNDMKKALTAVAGAVLIFGGFSAALLTSTTGCNTTQQRVAFNTLGSVESTATAGVDNYYLAAAKGLAPTNGIPKVTSLYNKFQADMQVAVLVAQNNTNALAPTNIVAEAGALLTAVAEFYPTSQPKLEKITPTP